MPSDFINSFLCMDERVTLITGAAGNVAAAIAPVLAELGSSLVLLDRSGADLPSRARQLSMRYGVRVEVIICDLESDDAVAGVPEWVQRKMGRLDVLINNAAFVGSADLQGWSTSFDRQSIATWRRALDVNLTAAFALTQGCQSLLEQSGHGSVINIGSIYGLLGPDLSLYEGTAMNNPAAYAASKGGLLQLTRWLATVLAPNIRVNAISPGGLERGQSQEFIDRYISRTPLRRMGREEDIMGAVAYLASDLSSWVTGQNIVVDGGWSVW